MLEWSPRLAAEEGFTLTFISLAGQIDVLEAALVWRQERFEETVGKAKDAGIDFMMEDLDEEE